MALRLSTLRFLLNEKGSRSVLIVPWLLLTQAFGAATEFFALQPPLLATISGFGGVARLGYASRLINQRAQSAKPVFAISRQTAVLLCFDNDDAATIDALIFKRK